jgi:carboxyl-terminal processing protease
MNRAPTNIPTRYIAWTLAALAFCTRALSDDASPKQSAGAHKTPAELAKRVMDITDAVLEHHLDPPTRQQMILDGVKALYRKAELPIPQGLSRRVSELTTPEQLAALLAGACPKSAAGANLNLATTRDEALIEGLLQDVPGEARLISAKDRNVEEQMAGNRYVGLHIALGMNDQEKRPMLIDVMEGGPADRAGAKQNDVLEQIDAVDTKGMPLREAVDRLRGAEGTSVTIKVRQPKSPESRTYKITRGQLPRQTVRGVRKRSSGGWDVRLGDPDPIGYLQITEISASTPHELHALAHQLESDGAQALVLDLRGLRSENLHAIVMVADALLRDGCIGRIRTAHGETKYQADSDVLFQDWPMVALVDGSTAGTAEWLAAALQDNHRAILVGAPTSSAQGMPGGGVKSAVPVGDGAWSIVLMTGRLERGNGRPLETPAMSSRRIIVNPLAAEPDAEEVTKLLRERSAAAFAAGNAAAKGSTPKTGTLALRHSVPGAKSQYGVKPDHTVDGPRAMLPARSPRRERPQEVSSESDGALKKAIALLREALKKHQN